MQIKMDKENILKRMLAAHHLTQRKASFSIESVVGTTGFHTPLQDTLDIELAARINGFSNETSNTLFKTGCLLRTIGVRGGIRALPARDWSVFNLALKPVDTNELLFMISGTQQLLAPLGLQAMDVLGLIVRLIPEVLDNSALSKSTLGIRLSCLLADYLSPSDRETWTWPSPLFEKQTLGGSLVQYLLPVAALTIPIPLVTDNKSNGFLYTVKKDVVFEDYKNEEAKELVKRYLHAYGPADSDTFAQWAGISTLHANRLWAMVPENELIHVEWEGKESWMLPSDAEGMQDIEVPEGVRYVSPYDPLLSIPKRNLLVHGKTQHNYFFGSVESPGMVLYDGQAIAGWRIRKKNRSCSILVEDIGGPLGRVAIDELEEEAYLLSTAMGLECDGVSIATSM